MRFTSRNRSSVLVKLFFFVLCVTAAVRGEDLAAVKLLNDRPDARYVEFREWQGDHGFILWTPTLTLAQVIEATGALKHGNDVIEIRRLATNPALDFRFGKNRLIQSPNVQRQTFDPGDLIAITRMIKPY